MMVSHSHRRVKNILTFILRSEFSDLRGEAFVELMLPGNEGLADRLLPEPHDAGVARHLVYERLQHHPLPGVHLPAVRLHDRFVSRTHPRSASDCQTSGTRDAVGEAASSVGGLAPYRVIVRLFPRSPQGGATRHQL